MLKVHILGLDIYQKLAYLPNKCSHETDSIINLGYKTVDSLHIY